MSSIHSTWQKYATLSAIAFLLIFSTFGLAWIWWFGNPLDPIWFRLTKHCVGCRFESSNVRFINANLAGADLRYANLSSGNFNQANLERADLSFARTSAGVPVQMQNVNLKEANLSHAAFPNINLARANLENANLQSTDLLYANLTNANLQNANLTGARLTGANLLNANFRGANLTGAKLCFIPTLPSSLADAILTNALITGVGQGFTSEQKQALENQGAIIGGGSENCF